MQKLSAKMTPGEFLAWEREQPTRHHYIHGEIFDMSGGSARHNRLGARLIAAFERQLEGNPCGTYTNDQKLGLADDLFVYADLSIICGRPEFRPGTRDVATNPRIVIEVLSKSTKAYDLAEKKDGYLALPSVEHVIFVEQQSPYVTVYSRQADRSFRYDVYKAGAKIALHEPKVTLSVDDIYAGVFELPGDD